MLVTRAEFNQLRKQLDNLIERIQVLKSDMTQDSHLDYDLGINDNSCVLPEIIKIEAEISELQKEIADAIIVRKNTTEIIGYGSVVTIHYIDNDEEMVVKLAQPLQSKKAGESICSPNSPMGKAIFGKSSGDIVEFSIPSGKCSILIQKVE